MKASLRILLVSNYLNIFAYSLFFPIYAIFVQDITPNVLVISSSLGWYTIVTGITVLVSGKFEDLIKRKEIMIILGYFILVYGANAYLLVHNTLTLFMVQTLNAIGIGIVAPAWKVLYAQHEDAGKEAREWSFFDGGNMLLAGIASVIGGFIAQYAGFGMLIVTMSVIQFFSALVSLRLAHNPPVSDSTWAIL